MSEYIQAYLPQLNRTLSFTKASDGWWECREWSRAISPEMDRCVMDPWYGDCFAGAPEFSFTMVSDKVKG